MTAQDRHERKSTVIWDSSSSNDVLCATGTTSTCSGGGDGSQPGKIQGFVAKLYRYGILPS
eukprot:COSAG05_NODE_62_length_23051_cov_19.660291_3_plen_61_part_00